MQFCTFSLPYYIRLILARHEHDVRDVLMVLGGKATLLPTLPYLLTFGRMVLKLKQPSCSDTGYKPIVSMLCHEPHLNGCLITRGSIMSYPTTHTPV